MAQLCGSMLHANTSRGRPATAFASRLKAFASLRKRVIFEKLPSTTQRLGSRTKPRFASDSLTTWGMIA
jgi:hypothetical protein